MNQTGLVNTSAFEVHQTPLPADAAAATKRPIEDDGLAFEQLRQRGFEAVQSGSLEEALLFFEAAFEVAEREGDRERIDLAICNRAVVRIELPATSKDALEEELGELRQVLARTPSVENGWLASHHVARIYERGKTFKKGLFYARMALDRSHWVERTDWRAYSHNLVGNLLLAESWVSEAVEHYLLALELLAGDPLWRARVLDNLGYCRVLDGEVEDGLQLLYESQEAFASHGAERYTLSNRLALAYGLIESGRPSAALEHAREACQLGRKYSDPDAVRNALYLLGEAQMRCEDETGAIATFGKLQRMFFPDQPATAEMLLSTDVLPLINLRA